MTLLYPTAQFIIIQLIIFFAIKRTTYSIIPIIKNHVHSLSCYNPTTQHNNKMNNLPQSQLLIGIPQETFFL